MKALLKLSLASLLFIALSTRFAFAEPHPEFPTYKAHANGISIAYQDFGDKDNDAILLIMGLGAQLIHWDDDFVQTLVGAGYRVVRFDNRDVGYSQKMYQDGKPGLLTGIRYKLGMSLNSPYKLDDMAADAKGLLDTLEIKKAHVVGVSMGGMIAQIMAAKYPDTIATLTSIMSTSGAEHLPQGTVEVRERPEDATREEIIQASTAFWKTMGGERNNYSDEQWHATNARTYDRSYYPAGFARQLWAIVGSGDRIEILKTIKQPTLVIHGTNDKLVPPAGGEHTAELVEGSKLVLIDGMGHYLDHQSKPQILSEILALTKAQ